MKKYQSYKSSDVRWIGDVPEKWTKHKIKYLFNHKKGVNGQKLTKEYIGENPGIYPVYSGVTKGNGELGRTNEYEFDLSNKVIFVSTVGSDTTVMSTRLLSGKFNLSQNCMIMIPKVEISTEFFNFLTGIDFPNRRNLLPIILKEGHRSVGMGEIDEFEYFLPPLHEQIQIVQFLDEKTELIEKLISTKERNITLLKEQRTSLINQVITKGLNSSVKMKDSGSEFIGKIPESWKCTKLGFYTKKIGSGSTPRGGSEVYVDSGVPFVRSQNVHFDGLRLDGVSFIDFETHKSMKGSTVVRGDVLLNITGGSIGRCCVVEEDNEMNVNQHVSIIRTTVELLNYYLNYLLGSDIGQSQVLFNLTGGNREGLTIEGIRNFFITIPNLKEQLEIVQHIDFKNKEIDDLVHLEQKKINLLKEYRQSLISEVVTGKIKVTTDE